MKKTKNICQELTDALDSILGIFDEQAEEGLSWEEDGRVMNAREVIAKQRKS